jgi:hypothetical protein
MPGPTTPSGKPDAPSTADLVAATPDARADRAAELQPEVAPEPDTSGKRVRAIPTHGGSTVSVSSAEFARVGVEGQSEVVWDFRKDDTTVKVGDKPGEITQAAADAITKLEPTRFEFMS